MILLRKNKHGRILLIITLLVISIAGGFLMLRLQKTEQVAILPLREDEVRLIERRHSISFSGSSAGTVKAGRALDVFFSLTNNGAVPIIALKIEFESNSLFHDFLILPDINSLGGGSALARPSIRTEGVFIRKGESFESKFGFGVTASGGYQVIITPYVLVGEWINLGKYIISFMVEDTVEATQKREVQHLLDENNRAITNINRAIGVEADSISELERHIAWLDRRILHTWSEKVYIQSKVDREKKLEIREMRALQMELLVKEREALFQENSQHKELINNFYDEMFNFFYKELLPER